MTLTATRRYAFGASVLVGLVATIVAVVLVSALLSDPEQVVLAMSDGELSSLFHLVCVRLMAAARVVIELL